jgi:tripartite-type tricarboxylate transporter receptor subunit TctC
MSYTLIMNWDIKPNKDQEYFTFVVQEWVPATSRLGLKMVAAWYTVYSRAGDVSKIRAEGIAETKDEMRQILNSPEWHEIQERLGEYVENYSQKIVETSGGFQI